MRNLAGLRNSVVLFFLAPLISEFLLGNLPITLLPALVVLAPMYGGGALLIREIVRRTGRSWPSIFLLGFAYAVLEEAFTTQTLFNPNYLHLNMHLLDFAHIEALGIGGWWTIFVISLHAVWSITVSIVLAESLFPDQSETPWLGTIGLGVTTLVFLFGIAATTFITLKMENERGGIFIASAFQFVSAATICILLVIAAFVVPRHPLLTTDRNALRPWIAGVCSLLAGSAFLLVPPNWDWGAVGIYLALYLIAILFILKQSSREGWSARHRLALAAGAALAYAWHAFPQPPVNGENPTIDLIGNTFFALGIIALIVIGVRRNPIASCQ